MLAAGGALSTAVGSVTDGALIMGVLGVNAVVGAAQRLRTEDAIGRLSSSVTSRLVRIRRDDAEVSVPPEALVPGDLVMLARRRHRSRRLPHGAGLGHRGRRVGAHR